MQQGIRFLFAYVRPRRSHDFVTYAKMSIERQKIASVYANL